MSKPRLTVLIIDDAGEFSAYPELLSKAAVSPYEVLRLGQEADLSAVLAGYRSQSSDVILLDLAADYSLGLRRLRQLGQMNRPRPPIVAVGIDRVEVAVQALKAGAADYLVRGGLTPESLRQSLQAAAQDGTGLAEGQCYQSLAEALPQIVWSADTTGTIRYWNRSWYDYTGLEATAAADGMGAALHPEERELVIAQWHQGIARGESFQFHCRLRRWDGEYETFLCQGVPMAVPSVPGGWLGIFTLTELADRQQLQASLRASQGQLQRQLAEIEAIYQTAPIGLNVLDRQLRFVRINQRLAEINGLPVEAHIGRSVRELLPDLADAAENLLQPILETGEPLYGVEIHGETPAQPGVKRTWIEHFLPLKRGDQVIGISTVCEEVTDRLQSEAQLRESERRFRNMADHAPMMVWMTDPEGRCTYMSKSWEAFTGQPVAEALGFGWLERVHPDDREDSRRDFLAARERRQSLRLEYRLRRHDGVYRWALDAARPWLGEDREYQGYIGSVIDISDRKQAELDLKQAHIQLEAALAAGYVYTWRWDVAKDRVRTDRNFARLFNLDPTAAQSGLPLETFVQAIHSEDRPRVVAAIRNAIATGHDYAAEYRIHSASGEERWVSARGRPEYDSHGNVIAFPGALADITDRKRADNDLRRSEARYRALFESMNEGFCVVQMLFDPENNPIDHRFLELNPLFEEQTGLRQAVGQTARQLLPDLEDFWFEVYGRVALTGEPVRFEHGSEAMGRYFEVSAFSIGERCDRKVAILFKDISDRKRAEKALRRSQDRLRVAVKSADLGTWDWNLFTDEITCDPGCEALLGLSTTQCHAEVFFAGVYTPDRQALEEAIATASDPNGSGDFRVDYRQIKSADDTQCWLAVRGQMYFNREHQPKRLVGTVVDITERKQAEVQREQLLHREQAARQAAERANRIKDEFLAILSHELRTPLNPILGWSRMLQTGQLNQKQTAKALSTIERNAKLQTQLIDDLLDVARILRGKLHLDSSLVDLADVIEAAIDTVRTAAAAKSISLERVLPSVGLVWGDAARLQQIVWNLLSNGIKFTPQGGKVYIQLQRHGDQAQITVTDTGKGISPDFIPHLFATFRQEDISTTREHGGLGLGLTIVRQLTEAHGGSVAASSPGEGRGATFTVRLPLYSGPVQPAVQPSASLEQDLSGISILAVDDNPDARELLTVLLEQCGAEVTTAAAAEEALGVLAHSLPDILISDIGMPGMDGYELIQAIRQLPPDAGGDLPAIALSAYVGDEDQQQALDSGYHRHVSKPLNTDKLMQAIIKALGTANASTAG